MIHTRAIKYIASVVLVAFIVTFALPAQQIAAASQIEKISLSQKTVDTDYKKPTPQTKLGSLSHELLQWHEKFKAHSESEDLNGLKTDAKNMVKSIKALRKDITEEFSRNEQTLKSLNAKAAQERQQKFKADLESKLNSLEAMVQSLDELPDMAKTLNQGEAKVLKDKIGELEKILMPEQPQQPLGALPHSDVNIQPPAPATGGGTTAAYMESTAGASASSFSPSPTEGDLAETDETRISDEIESLAYLLSDNPVEVFEHVRNTIKFEPYYGSRKGAAGTLREESGNDADQASLLIALLRAKNIPARYVYGTVEIPIDKVKSWVNADTSEAAVRTLGSGGIPVVSIVNGGQISAARFEHVWVEAYVPYEDYRGTGNMQGKKTWVPLDPSFKQMDKQQGLDLKAITGTDFNAIADTVKNAGTLSEDKLSVTNVDVEAVKNELSLAVDKLEKYIKENNLEKAKPETVLGGMAVVPEHLGLLPLTLPYKTVAVLKEYSSLPEDIKDFIGFSIRGADPFNLNFYGEKDFSIVKNSSDLYGKKITLSWIPASEEDAAIINQYGGIFNVPAYLVQMKPQLKIDGKVEAEGKAVNLGYRQQFTMSFKSAGQQAETIENPVTVGSFYCVGLDYQSISTVDLTEIAERIRSLQPTLSENNIYSDEGMGEILHGVAKAYFMQLDIADRLIKEQYKVNTGRFISEAMTGYNARVSYMFMSPVELSEGSLYIDVDRDVRSVVSRNSDTSSEKAYMISSGVIGSAMEHGIYEEILGVQSVSTIKVLEEANAAGIPIYTVTKKNIGQVMQQLQVSEAVKTDIRNAVNGGRIVTIPKNNMTLGQWNGVGYIVLDPETGAAGYMISGGIAGGSTEAVVALASIANLALAIADIVEAAMLLACTGLTGIGGLIAVAFLALAIFQLVSLMMQLYDYYINGNDAAAGALITDAIIGLVSFGALSGLKGLAQRLKGLEDLCFTEDTLVYSSQGLKRIKDIQPGDEVYSYSAFNSEKGIKKVQEVFVNETRKLINLSVGDTVIKVTPSHSFLSKGKGWIAAGAIVAGDELVRYNNEVVEVKATEVVELEEPIKVYNFEVEDYHTYCVSGQQVVVHNTCPRDFGTGLPVNKAGKAYPQVVDPRTGRNIDFPEGNLQKVPKEQRVEWNSQTRGEYIKEWYDRGYQTPEGGWDMYDIHHIKPREYGGSNSFENLVPVIRDTHQTEFNTFWLNY